MNYLLRRFVPRDIEKVRELHQAAFGDAFDPERPAADLGTIVDYYIKPGGEFLVGMQDSRMIAMGGLLRVSESLGEIKRMRVKTELQGRGIGTHVLQTLEICARNRGFSELTLNTTGAQGFYASRGYMPTHTEDGLTYLRKTLVVSSKSD